MMSSIDVTYPWIEINDFFNTLNMYSLSHCLTCPTSSGVLHGVSHKIIHHHFLCWYLELDSILALISFSYFCIFRDLSDFICQRKHTVCPFSVYFLFPLWRMEPLICHPKFLFQRSYSGCQHIDNSYLFVTWMLWYHMLLRGVS